ncbi:MAG: hypothetical protein ACXV8U_02895 [Methylobacter sp.]
MCNYQAGTVECRGDGYLWDADNDGYDPDETNYPCPQCNTMEYLKNAKDEAESTSEGTSMGFEYTGESIWMGAIRNAEERNPEATRESLIAIKAVDALVPANNDDGYEVVRYVYA